MRFEKFSFGSIRIDGTTYQYDVVIDRGQIRKRKKKPSKPFRDAFGHTPLSIEEEIPWKCSRLLLIRLFQQTTIASIGRWRGRRFQKPCASSSRSSPPKRLANSI